MDNSVNRASLFMWWLNWKRGIVLWHTIILCITGIQNESAENSEKKDGMHSWWENMLHTVSTVSYLFYRATANESTTYLPQPWTLWQSCCIFCYLVFCQQRNGIFNRWIACACQTHFNSSVSMLIIHLFIETTKGYMIPCVSAVYWYSDHYDIFNRSIQSLRIPFSYSMLKEC